MARVTAKFVNWGTGTDQVSGLKMPVGYSPTYYTPVQVNNEGADKVSAHFKGLDSAILASATPGLTFGRSGNIPNNSYLLQESVPSNISGRVALVGGTIETVSFVCENVGTYVISIERRSGNSFVQILQMTVTNKRVDAQNFSNIAISYRDEIACKVVSGGPKNVSVGIQLRKATV